MDSYRYIFLNPYIWTLLVNVLQNTLVDHLMRRHRLNIYLWKKKCAMQICITDQQRVQRLQDQSINGATCRLCQAALACKQICQINSDCLLLQSCCNAFKNVSERTGLLYLFILNHPWLHRCSLFSQVWIGSAVFCPVKINAVAHAGNWKFIPFLRLACGHLANEFKSGITSLR